GLLDICPMAGLCGDQLAARGFIWLNATPDRISAPATAMLGVSASSSRSHAHTTPNNGMMYVTVAARGSDAMDEAKVQDIRQSSAQDAEQRCTDPRRHWNGMARPRGDGQWRD